MMLGTWEKELHTTISNLKPEGTIICIGAAEGYYAVGLAKLHLRTNVYAYEAQSLYGLSSKKMLREMELKTLLFRGCVKLVTFTMHSITHWEIPLFCAILKVVK